MGLRKTILAILAGSIAVFCACSEQQEHTAPAVGDNDSLLPFMTARGVNTLISDSGVIRYKLLTEEWQIYGIQGPQTWKFLHGFFMERYDQDMHPDLFVQADTAYLHDQRTWELRGRVVIKNLEGTLFLTQELFWDMSEHTMWNHMPMDIYMPDRDLHGTDFRSNEQMTDYFVTNSSGSFPAKDAENTETENTETITEQDALAAEKDSQRKTSTVPRR